MKKASIDIGSNSILLCVGQKNKQGGLDIIREEVRITALGKGIKTNNRFDEQSLADSIEVLIEFAKVCTDLGLDPDSIVVTATEASRRASNFYQFQDQVYAQTKLKIELISAEDEAHFTALGIALGENVMNDFIIMDMGGASTELTWYDRASEKVIDFVSLPIGSLIASEWDESNQLEEKFSNLKKQFERPFLQAKLPNVIGCAGTVTAIAAMIKKLSQFIPEAIHQSSFSALELEQLAKQINFLSDEEMRCRYPFLGKRVATIRGGIKLCQLLMNSYQIRKLSISTYGLRQGTLWHRFFIA